MSIRSALQIGRAFPPAGNQDLTSVLGAGNTANQQDILGVGNLVCATINGDPIGGSGLASVLAAGESGGGKDIYSVNQITCNKLVELGRSKFFEYIVGDTIAVANNTAFQLDIDGGTITLEEGSYVFNVTVNLSANLAIDNYSILLDLDGTILGKTTVQATTSLTTLIINSLPVTRVLPAAGVVTLKCIVNAPSYVGLNVTLTGPPGSAFSYLSWVEVYLGAVPPPLEYPFTPTGTQPLQIDVNGNEYIYYMKTPGATTLTPNYSFTLDEIFVVGAGKNGSGKTGGNGGGVVSYLTPSISVSPANIFTISVAKEGGNSAASVAGYGITLDSSQDLSPAAGGTANNNGNPGVFFATTGITYGGSGAGGGQGSSSSGGANGKTGGLGGGGGSGSYTLSEYFSGGSGGGDGVNSGGAGGSAGTDGANSQYGGGGGDGYSIGDRIGGAGGNGGTYGGIGGGGVDGGGGGGGGGGNLGGGGGGGGGDEFFAAGAGGGGAGIIIIKVTV
jgi:hypothetical protein